MVKSIRSLWAFTLMMLIFIASQSLDAQATPADDVLILKGGIPEGLIGYEVKENGELFIHDPVKKNILSRIESKLKIKITWQAFPTTRVLLMLDNERIDLAFPMALTDERNTLFLPSSYTWITRNYHLTSKEVDMLNVDINVGVILNSPQYEDMKNAGYSNISMPTSIQSLINMLQIGRIDVAVIPESSFVELKTNWPTGVNYKIGKTRTTGFYLKISDPKKLLLKLNTAIEACRNDS